MSNITYEVSGGIAVIKFNRPEKLNTLTLSMYDDLGAAFVRAQEDPKVAVVILTGEGDRAFLRRRRPYGIHTSLKQGSLY